MKKQMNQRSVSGLAALFLLTLFALGILLVLLAGSDVYQKMIQRDRLAYDSRLRTQYVATKVRQAASAEAVSVEDFGRGSALVIRQETQMGEYLTRIYCCDGWLMELFSDTQTVFQPRDGERIVPADAMTVLREGNLLHVSFEYEGAVTPLFLCLPGEEQSL